MMMAVWPNDDVFKFIQAYRNEESIWNPKFPSHKDKSHINQAWIRISNIMDMTIPTLKRKKEALLATYRFLKRKKISMATTCGTDYLYHPSWIFFDAIDAFLGDVYVCSNPRKMMKLEEVFTTEDGTDESEWDIDLFAAEENLTTTNSHQADPKSSHVSDLQEANKYMKYTCNILNSLLNKQRDEDDECVLFGKLVTKRLLKIPEIDRQKVMLEIDVLLLNKLTGIRGTQVPATQTDETSYKFFDNS